MIMIDYVYLCHIKYVYIYIIYKYTFNKSYNFVCVCVHILSHKRAPASTSDWLQDMNSSKEMAPE